MVSKLLSIMRSRGSPSRWGLSNMSIRQTRNHFRIKKLIVPSVVMLAFCGVGIWGWLASGFIQPLLMFGYIGASVGIGLGLYEILPKQKKPVDAASRYSWWVRSSRSLRSS